MIFGTSVIFRASVTFGASVIPEELITKEAENVYQVFLAAQLVEAGARSGSFIAIGVYLVGEWLVLTIFNAN